jgi:hypothetical protein
LGIERTTPSRAKPARSTTRSVDLGSSDEGVAIEGVRPIRAQLARSYRPNGCTLFCRDMQKRTLGPNNLEVSELGLGCMGMSQSYLPIPDKQEMVS